MATHNIDVTQVLYDYEGEALTDDKGNLTVRRVILFALNVSVEKDEADPETKARMYALSLKVQKYVSRHFNLEERTLIKKRVGLVYGPLIFGRISDVLEGRTTKEQEQEVDSPDEDEPEDEPEDEDVLVAVPPD